MGWLRYFCIGGLFAAAISQVSDPAASRDGARLAIEAYPKIIEQRMHRRVQELDELPEMLAGIGAKLVVVKRARRWQPGSTIKVAFEQAKGDQQVRSLVQSAAMIWTQHANITLEFSDVNTGEFHEFSSDDNDYVADIRISFRTGEAIGRLWGRTVELTTTISLGNRR